MESVLVTLTVTSLAAAAGFGVVAWRSRIEEHRRSAARVAALAGAISTANAVSPGAAATRSVPVTSMFETASGGAIPGRPLMKMGIVAALATVLVIIVAMASRDHTQVVDATPDGAPLELVSTRDARDGSALTVSGLVRNPRSGASLAGISAVVFAFDQGGTFVTSAKAPIDFTVLEPGDESPFVVTIPDVADVGRYRVSFRTEAGILGLVDRRATLQASAN